MSVVYVPRSNIRFVVAVTNNRLVDNHTVHATWGADWQRHSIQWVQCVETTYGPSSRDIAPTRDPVTCFSRQEAIRCRSTGDCIGCLGAIE